MAKQLSEHTRLVDKKGRNQVSGLLIGLLTHFFVQVSFKDMEEQNALYMKDVFTSMVDAHWYYVLIAFFASFFGKCVYMGLQRSFVLYVTLELRTLTLELFL